MRPIIITLLAICLSATAHSQFLYNVKTVASNRSSKNIQKSTTDSTPDSTKALLLGPSIMLGLGNNESISVIEIVADHISKDKRDRLAFGGTIAKSDSKQTADIKTLLQGGGNFFLSYSYPLLPRFSKSNRPYFLLMMRTKLGALLPGAGSTTNVIQASLDPGLELLFSLITISEKISITASARGSLLWASKDFSDATGFNKNLIPYGFITGGFKIKSVGTIAYSQSFLSSSLSISPLPKASLGFSVTLE